MTRLRPLPHRKIHRGLVSLGFSPIRQRGSHVIYQHADGRVTVVPSHAAGLVKRGLIKRILDDVGVSWEEFESRL